MKNKKAQEGGMWPWVVGGAVAVIIGLIYLSINNSAFAGVKQNLNSYQTCEGRQGICVKDENACQPPKAAYFKNLGCGSADDEKNKALPWCCLPPP